MAETHEAVHLVAATIFGIVALVHALRLGFQTPIMIGGWEAPMWVSWLAVFFIGSLAVLMWDSRGKD